MWAVVCRDAELIWNSPGQKRHVPEPSARCVHRGAFRRQCKEIATAGTVCQKHSRECRFTGCDARSDGRYCKEHGCGHAGCGRQRLLAGKKFDGGSKYCKKHKCVHCCRKAVWRGRLKRHGYCRTHTCHTDFCGTGTMSKGARSCRRHKCAYCNSAVVGYRGGFHNRHCKKHSCLMCLNGTTSATAQVCQNHACKHPRCFGRCRRGIAGDIRGRADRDGRCANCWSRPHLYGNPHCQPCHEDYLRRREEKDRQWEAEERRLKAEENPRRRAAMQQKLDSMEQENGLH